MAEQEGKRSSGTPSGTPLGLAVLAGLVLLGAFDSPGATRFGLRAAAALAALLSLMPVLRSMARSHARRAVLAKTAAITAQQIDALARRRAQLVRPDPYGKLQNEKWERELDYFIQTHLRPSLSGSEQAALARNYDQAVEVIARRVEEALQAPPAFPPFSDDMSPADFEAFCAQELRHAGWNARVTLQSRDQGVDVIAEKNGIRIVLQCKLYRRAVGNKAVQEIAAARAHEQADFGAVVSNSNYTAAAEQLAATNRLLLLHFRDLRTLDSMLGA